MTRRPPGCHALVYATPLLMGLALTVGCGLAGPQSPAQDPPAAQGWQPALSQQQIETVRQFFPGFQAEMFAPGTDLTAPADFAPSDFSPAEFFGPPAAGDPVLTPEGISVRTNGYDSEELPDLLPQQITYFDRSGDAQRIQLTTAERSPLNLIEQRMGLAPTPDAPVLSIDLRQGRVSLADIDAGMLFIRDQLAAVLPEVASVDPTGAQIVIEPSIFYVFGSNMGNTWAGGETEPLGGGRYLVRLSEYYITFDAARNPVVTNWKDYLVDEGINFFVLSIGRRDLAL